MLLPVLDTLWLSLHDVVLYRPRSRPFIGLANYARALADPVFWESLGNSLVWVVCAVSLQFMLGNRDGAAAEPELGLARYHAGVGRCPVGVGLGQIGLIWTWRIW